MSAAEREMRIPKRIHYCWFGGQPLSADARAMIATWRHCCPDYEIVEWNESNFDVNENAYVREAYEAKKWAFVTDYVRLKALYEQGGFYMDTDVEVVKSLDPLRVYDAVFGYESKTSIQTCIIGTCLGNEWIGMLLRDYDGRSFRQLDGSNDMTTNVQVITRLTVERYGLVLDGTTQRFGGNMILLPFDYLCAKLYQSGEVVRTPNTYTIHHFNGSWLPEAEKRQVELGRRYIAAMSWLPWPCLRNNIATTLSVGQVFGLGVVLSRGSKKLVRLLKRGK